ncbi:hypothetical protein ACHAWF_000839, partial [Thalassiosira exigua]
TPHRAPDADTPAKYLAPSPILVEYPVSRAGSRDSVGHPCLDCPAARCAPGVVRRGRACRCGMNAFHDGDAVVEEVAQNIYDDLLKEITIEVACGVHRAAKTGKLPYFNVMAGSDRPTNGNERMTIETEGAKGYKQGSSHDLSRALEEADSVREASDAKKRRVEPDSERGSEDAAQSGASSWNNAGSASSNNASDKSKSSGALKAKVHVDIYGRTPGKEPSHPIPCPNYCGRQISSSRMALHLEKCLGLVKKRGSNTTGSSGARRSSGTAGSSAGKGGKVSRQGKQAKKR